MALSRAIGDFEFKQNPSLTPEHQIVTGGYNSFFFICLSCMIFVLNNIIPFTAYPEVRKEDITEKAEFLVLACDGNFFFNY